MTSIKDFITILSLLVASYVGIQGLNTWKRSLSGTERHQKAKNLLLDLYIYKDRLYDYRHPGLWAFEYPPSKNNDKSPAFKQTTYEDKEYIYQNRLNKVKEYTRKLYIHKLEGKILFSPDLDQKIQQILTLENKISNQIRIYLKTMKSGNEYPYDEKIIYDDFSPEDPIRKEMELLISEVEKIVYVYLI